MTKPTPMVALLRGVNVGGKKLPMADLRRVVEGCGYESVSTYIQSGNVVFVAATTPATAATTIEDAITAGTDISSRVTVRTAAQMQAVVADNPFLDRTDDPTKLHVVFAMDGPAALPDWCDPTDYEPEELAVLRNEAYLYLPDGMGRSKLAVDLTKRGGKHAPVGTARNWRTVGVLTDQVTALT